MAELYRIIFLDVDGVLINRASFRLPRLDYEGERVNQAHPDCVAVLNHITDATGAKLVMSSVWRQFGSCAYLRGLLREWGVTGTLIDKTPRLTERTAGAIVTALPRGREIQYWMDHWQREDIESFVILDDDSDMEHLAPRLVKTDFEHGLTMADAERAIALLMQPARKESATC